jgi:hypothetical protein
MTLTGKRFSTWNYRVVAQTIDGEPMYGIHECYYEPIGWTANPVPVVAETVDGLREQLNRMLIALDLDVIQDRTDNHGPTKEEQ